MKSTLRPITAPSLEALGMELAAQPKLTSEWQGLAVDQRIEAMWESAKIFDRHFHTPHTCYGIVVQEMEGQYLGSMSRLGELTLATRLFERDDSLEMVRTLAHEYQHRHQLDVLKHGRGLRAWLVRANWDHYFPTSRSVNVLKRLDGIFELLYKEGDPSVLAFGKAMTAAIVLSPLVVALSLTAAACLLAYRFQPIETDAYRAGALVRRSLLRTLQAKSQLVPTEEQSVPPVGEVPPEPTTEYRPSEHVLYWANQPTLSG